MRTDTPVPIKLSAYQPYNFAIDMAELRFDLNPKGTRVEARLDVRRTAPGDMVLDGVGLDLETILVDGNALTAGAYTLEAETLTLHDVPDQFVLETRVRIVPAENTALSGLYVSGERLCTQCEADGFRRITYWPDRPDVMSCFRVRLEGDKARYPYLLSNGTPGEAGDLTEGRHFAVWDDPHPKPSYLFALCAGDYDVYRDRFTTMSGREVDLAIHVDKGDAARAAYAMDALKRSMTWDEQVFGREYDLGVFNIVAVRDFNFGAMENKGLNIFNSAYVLADDATATDDDFEAIESIVAHEYFHNWTGHRITCRDWFQLCLKEGLTVFRDQEFSADMRSRAVQRIKDVIRLRARQFAEDAGPLAHPVRPDAYASVDNLYTATVYEKGAELIRMLKGLIGADAFARGMDLYFERHDGDAATIEDFYACFEAASGEDLSDFRRWYAQPGTPVISVRQEHDTATGKGRLTFTQTNPPTPGHDSPAPLPVPLRWSLLGVDGAEEKLTVIDTAEVSIPYETTPGTPAPLVSLNRGFSAPIRVETDLSKADRLILARSETDPFNRWDTLRGLVAGDILSMAYDQASAPDGELVDAVAGAVIEASKADPAYAALLLRVPSVSELFLERHPADPTALQSARNRLRPALAAHAGLHALADEVLAAPSPTPFRPDAKQAGIRALRTALSSTLAASGAPARDKLAGLFSAAPNMTEQLSALRALVEIDGGDSGALTAFYEQWQDQPLVIDKWFQVQAAYADSADTAKRLVDHADFDLSNPNRVRSVAAVFASQNLAAFHARDGRGHAFLADLARQADTRNPALAARLLTAFEQWRTLEPEARASAERVLRNLGASDLSKNASDIVGRALAD